MLKDTERAIIEENTLAILKSPLDITQHTFMELYNTIYSFCTAPADSFDIEGEDIYLLLKGKLLEFTTHLSFKAQISDISKKLQALSRSCQILSNAYNYLERYYIKTSELSTVRQLFYQNVYYNHIYSVEANLLALVFLEIETARENYFSKTHLELKEADEISNLRQVVRSYIDMILVTKQEQKQREFYKRYLQGFSESTDFNMGMGKLLKRVFIELYIICNILNEKDLRKDVVEPVERRMGEMMAYLFKKIEDNEPFKYIFTIISVMSEDRKEWVAQRYCEVVRERISRVQTFEKLYDEYALLKEQILKNKMTGYQEILDREIREEFLEDEMKQKCIGRSLIKIVNEEILSNFEEIESMALMKMGIKSARKDEYSAGFLKLRKRQGIGRKYNIFLLIKLMGMISDEKLIQKYTNNAQSRLLFGSSVYVEHYFMDSLAKALGSGVLSRLKNTIESVMNSKEITSGARIGRSMADGTNNGVDSSLVENTGKIEAGLADESGAIKDDDAIHDTKDNAVNDTKDGAVNDSVSVAKFNVKISQLTKCFWKLEKEAIHLPSAMEAHLKLAESLLTITSRDIIEYNYKYSPVIVRVAGTLYRMNATMASLMFHVVDNPGILVQDLEGISGDPCFEQTFRKLAELGFFRVDKESGAVFVLAPRGIGNNSDRATGDGNLPPDRPSRAPSDGSNAMPDSNDRTLDNRSALQKYDGGKEQMVDLFEADSIYNAKEEEGKGSNNELQIMNAKIMRKLKREKEMAISRLEEETKINPERLLACVRELEGNGYLFVEENVVHYIP